jgi:hypothetical protein
MNDIITRNWYGRGLCNSSNPGVHSVCLSRLSRTHLRRLALHSDRSLDSSLGSEPVLASPAQARAVDSRMFFISCEIGRTPRAAAWRQLHNAARSSASCNIGHPDVLAYHPSKTICASGHRDRQLHVLAGPRRLVDRRHSARGAPVQGRLVNLVTDFPHAIALRLGRKCRQYWNTPASSRLSTLCCSHVGPTQPWAHVHANAASMSVHLAPFLHGETSHSSISRSQRIPS